MTPEQEERLVTAFESIALSLSKRLTIDHPEPVEAPPAEVYNIHDDRPQPETKEEYDDHEGGEGRFASILKNAQRTNS